MKTQMQEYEAKSQTGDDWHISEKSDGDNPLYVTLKDAVKHIGIPLPGLRGNLESVILKGLLKGTVYEKYGIDGVTAPLVVVDGDGTLSTASVENVYVLMDYVHLRRELRDRSGRRNIISLWDLSVAMRGTSPEDRELIETSFVKAFQPYTPHGPKNRISSAMFLNNRSMKKHETTMYALDPHSTRVIPASVVARVIDRSMNAVPRYPCYPSRYSLIVLNNEPMPKSMSVNANRLFEIGLISEQLLIAAHQSEKSESVQGELTIIRPSDLAEIAGGVGELKAAILGQFEKDASNDKIVSHVKTLDSLLNEISRYSVSSSEVSRMLRRRDIAKMTESGRRTLPDDAR